MKENNPRWFYRNFDRRWVTCQICKKSYLLETVKRKNKCPNCKVDNRLCATKIVKES